MYEYTYSHAQFDAKDKIIRRVVRSHAPGHGSMTGWGQEYILLGVVEHGDEYLTHCVLSIDASGIIWGRGLVLAGWVIGQFYLSFKTYRILRWCLLKTAWGCNLWTKTCCLGGILLMTHILQTRLYPLGTTIHYGSASLLLSSWKLPVSRGIWRLI